MDLNNKYDIPTTRSQSQILPWSGHCIVSAKLHTNIKAVNFNIFKQRSF